MATALGIGDAARHVVFTGVSWCEYEQTLRETGDRPVRISFLDGVMEIMSPLPEHDAIKTAIGDLIACLATERRIPRKSFGSATFRREDKAAGAEPDGCFYFGDIDQVRGMKRFDPLTHRSPDLWIEVDLLSPSVPREPIYARLGVPEVWRYGTGRLSVRLLTGNGSYGSQLILAPGTASKLAGYTWSRGTRITWNRYHTTTARRAASSRSSHWPSSQRSSPKCWNVTNRKCFSNFATG